MNPQADLGPRIARISLHVLVAAVPLAHSNFSWLPGVDLPFTFDEFDTVKMALLCSLAAFGLVAWLWSFVGRGGWVRWSRIYWLVLAFIGWAVLSTAFSIHPATAFLGKYRRYDGLVTFVAYAAVLFVMIQVIDTPARRRALARTAVIAGAAVAAYGVAQYLGFDPIARDALPFESNRAYSTMGNPDLLGGYLIFPLTLAAVLALTESSRRWQIAYWTSFLLAGGAWLTAFTRGAWIGGALALGLVGIAYLRSGLRPSRVDMGFGVGTVLMGAVIVARSLSSPNQVTNALTRLRSIFRFGEGSAQTRFEIWQAAMRSIEDRPMLGHGPDTFRLVFRKFAPPEYVRDAGWNSVADNAHNYVLQAASGVGVPGAVLLYGVFGWSLWEALPAALDRRQPRQSLLLAGFWAAAVGYVTYLFFGLSVIGSTTLLWVSLGVLLGPSTTSRRSVIPKAWRLARVPIVVGGLVVVLASCTLLAADHYYLASHASPTTRQALPLAKRAVTLNPLNGHYRSLPGEVHAEIGESWFRQAATEARAGVDPSASLKAGEAAAREAIDVYEQAIDFTLTEADNYINLAMAQREAGQANRQYLAEVAQTVRLGLKVYPTSPMLRIQGALAMEEQGRADEAIPLAEEAVALDPRFGQALAVLGDLYAQNGRTEEALASYRRALELDPGDPTLTEIVHSLEASVAPQTGATDTP